MSDLRETVARAIHEHSYPDMRWEQELPRYRKEALEDAQAAIAAARPVIERELLERLIAEADGMDWQDRVSCEQPGDWLRSHLDDPERSHMTTDTTSRTMGRGEWLDCRGSAP